VQPRKEPNFSYRLLRAIYLAFQLLFPNQVIRADDLARAMVNVAIRGTERGCLVFETVTSAPWSKLLLENRRRAADPLPL